MAILNPTYRILDDGERIEGAWRPILIRNGNHYLANLKIYADGLIDCWGLVDLDGFRGKVRSGWVATTLPPNATVSAHGLGWWKAEVGELIGPEELISEVEDTLAELQGRPTTSEHFRGVLDAFTAEPTDEQRPSLRAAYAAVPVQLRRYLIGDQDMADWPVQVLIGELGEPVVPRMPPFKPRPITEEDRRHALEYLAARRTRDDEWRTRTNDNDPDGPPAGPVATSVGEGGIKFAGAGGWADLEGDGYLSNDTPVAITVAGVHYPSVTHAYWAMSTFDDGVAEAIRLAAGPSGAARIGMTAPRRENWSAIRLAVMADLLRAKYDQHPELGAKLLATGEARIRGAHTSSGSFWSSGQRSRNWVGRLHEVIRSELRLRTTADDRSGASDA